MKCFKHWTYLAAIGLFGVMSMGSGVRAAHVISVSESGGPTIPVLDNGPLDSDIASPGVISVDTTLLNLLLVNFSFSSLDSVSNPSGMLTQSGVANPIGSGGAQSLTITAYDTDYLLPVGNPKTMTTAASDSFLFTVAGDSRTFQSVFDPANSDPPGAGILSPLLVFVPPTGPGPFNVSNSGVDTLLGSQPIPYGLSNRTVITLNQSTAGTPQDSFSGTTSISAPAAPVPLPSAAMGGAVLMVAGMVTRGWRRRG